jgi:hypothetical protein
MLRPAPQSPTATVTRLSSVPSARILADLAPSPLPKRIVRYRLTPEQVPVDFFADPDGCWEFTSLVEMAGFNPEHPGASVGALTAAFDGFPEGAAVIAEVGVDCRYVALAELPAAPGEAASLRPSRQPHRAA